MLESDDAVVILKGPQPELSRAAEHLSGHGIASQVVCPDAGSS